VTVKMGRRGRKFEILDFKLEMIKTIQNPKSKIQN
jgi:hypothetical protein